MPKPLIHRALLILQAICLEAERRGYEIAKPDHERETFIFRIDSFSYPLMMREIVDRKRHELTASESEEASKSYFARFPQWDETPTGLLEISLETTWKGHPYRWGDRKRFRLEDRLGAILEGIAVRHEIDIERVAERKRVQEQREAAWKSAMDLAIKKWREQMKLDLLNLQIEQWEQALRIRTFVNQFRTERKLSEDVSEFLSWAIDYADKIDPIKQEMQIPDTAKEPLPSELQPFLSGWSAYGP